MVAEPVPARGTVVPGTMLTRPQWLSERIADMGISWGTGDSRVSGTLWWCMAASSLVDPIAAAYAEGRAVRFAELEGLRCEVRPDGGIERVLPVEGDDTATTDDVGPLLRKTLERIIPAVAEVSGASVASLWAIVADAIGNRALDAGDGEAGTRLGREIAGRLPVPRFVEITPRTFVRRISCCLVFEVPGCDMCTSCPKRPSAERQELLAALAAQR